MTIQVLQVPPIGTNCYLLKDDETGKGAVIDPGGDGASIRSAVDQMGMTPVAILLTLLAIGIKDIRLGPSLPAFVTPNVLKFLVDNFNIKPISTADEDLKAILG